MALNAIIRKANLQIADMDRHLYLDHAVTLAQHPSETEERVMIRLLALALNVPSANDTKGPLLPAKSLWDTDEPDLWQKDLTGSLLHWIDLGQPDERRLARACGRAEHVSVYTYAASTPVWWKALSSKVSRLRNLTVWEIPSDQSQALVALCNRSMSLQITVQDGHVWITDGDASCDIMPVLLKSQAGLTMA
jgi:uncharacterized protein YaeQ